MYYQTSRKKAPLLKSCFIILILSVFPSFVIKKINPPPLGFYVMNMAAAQARNFADPANDFEYFIFQHINPDNSGGGPRHEHALITYTYYAYSNYPPANISIGPHDDILTKSEIPLERPNPITIPGNVRLANFRLSKSKLSLTLPTSFHHLVFKPFRCNSSRPKEIDYVCYEIYPADVNGNRIGSKKVEAPFYDYTVIIHPSPPAGFD